MAIKYIIVLFVETPRKFITYLCITRATVDRTRRSVLQLFIRRDHYLNYYDI